MKCVRYLLVIMILALPIVAQAGKDAPADVRAKLQKEMLLGSSSQGNSFMITIPPNEIEEFSNEISEIYVAALKPTKFKLYIGSAKSLERSYNIDKPMGVVTISRAQQVYEVRGEEEVLGSQSIIIESERPVSVYVMNAKDLTTDGYMAIPISSWGTEYIHCSYYDNAESYGDYAGGFIIMASQDGTSATITARGRGGDFDSTSKGHALGDVWSVNLNSGEYYMVRGMGRTDGVFDLSGTLIQSDKPIGLISFHERCNIPFAIGNGVNRDCLNEMLPPVTSWGTKYVTCETDRGAGGKGDYFRIMASEPNTKFTITWYDIKDFNVAGKVTDIIKKAGEFYEYLAFGGSIAGTDVMSINGVAVFEANKPIMVNQYFCSESWDNSSDGPDPSQIVISSVEQYTTATIFQVPSNKSFMNNKFNLIVQGDTTDVLRNDSLLKSIKLDGEAIYLTAPKLLTNRIPNTDLFFVKGFPVEIGSHYILGDTKFGGYIYGRKDVDSYGWPAAMQIRKLDEVDTLAPEYEISGTCGEYQVDFTELRNGKVGDNPKQVESGVIEVPLLLDGSFNFYEPEAGNDFSYWPPNYEQYFKLKVIDKTKDATAIFAINDREGNIATDVIRYFADNVVMEPNPVDFGEVRKGFTGEQIFKLFNKGNGQLLIDTVYIQNGKDFKLLGKHQDSTIAANKYIQYDLQYKPSRESTSEDDFDLDSIIVYTNCLRFSFPIRGRGVLPKIRVEDFNAGLVVAGEELCNTVSHMPDAIRIRNMGSTALTLTGYTKDDDTQPFNEHLNITFPIDIPAGGTLKIERVCFTPLVAGSYKTNVTFHSNAESGDSVSVWEGTSAQPGPMISSKDWGEVRVKTVNPGQIEIWNQGTSSVSLTGIKIEAGADTKGFVNATPQFADENGNTLTPALSTPVSIEPQTATAGIRKVYVKWDYTPDAEYGKTTFTATPTFAKKDNITEGSVVGTISGTGILPKIETYDITFPGVVEVNQPHDSTITLTISSTSASSVLFIKELRLTGANPGDFTITPDISAIKNVTLDKVGGANDKLTLQVTFTPKGGGARTARLEIDNDAATGPEVNPIITTIANINGLASTTGAEITDIDYGTVTRCDEPVKEITITNLGSEELVLDSLVIPAEFVNVLVPVNFTKGQAVAGLGTYKFTLKFVANQRSITPEAFTVPINVWATQKGVSFSLASTIKGDIKTSSFTFSMPKIDGMIPGMKTTSQYKKFPISMELKSGSWADAGITSIRIEIKRDRRWFKLLGIEKGAVPGDWTFSGTEADDAIIINGSGNTPLSGGTSIELCNPAMEILLSDATVLKPVIDKLSYNDRDDCVLWDKVDGEIKLEACVAELRNVMLSNTQYKMAQLSPNPVSGSEFNLGYSVGLDNSETHIEMVNSVGELVQVIFDGLANEGEYNAKISTADMSAGVYTIKMVSGPYSATQKFVFVK